MGLVESRAAFFAPGREVAAAPDDDRDLGDIEDSGPTCLELLYNIERRFWRETPPWLQPPPPPPLPLSSSVSSSSARDRPHRDPRRHSGIDPMTPMTAHEALQLIPTLLDDRWIAALVALADNADVIIQSTSLALLARILHTATAAEVFVKVNGISSIMKLLTVESVNVRYLTLEVIHVVCAKNERMTNEFFSMGLMEHIAALAGSACDDLAIASLKILKLTLVHDSVKSALGTCDILPMLLKLAHVGTGSVSSLAVLCIGLSLPNASNMAQIVHLGCVETLLKMMYPPNPQTHVVIRALFLIAEDDVRVFPRELTILIFSKLLDTLRGGAKRSKNASSAAYLFSSLVKSQSYHAGLCSEANLSILLKLLIGGSIEVLRAAAFALGVVAMSASDSVKELLLSIMDQDSLLKLLDSNDDIVVKTAVFAIGCILDDVVVLPRGSDVDSTRSVVSPPLRRNMHKICQRIAGGQASNTVFTLLTSNPGVGSTFAAKVATCLLVDVNFKARIADDGSSIKQMLSSVCKSSTQLLKSVLLFFIECSDSDSGDFCKLIHEKDPHLASFLPLFDCHSPDSLMGLLMVFSLFSTLNPGLKAALSSTTCIKDVLTLLSKVSNPQLHFQALHFLDVVTSKKNKDAICLVFDHSPDRIANLLHASRPDLKALALTVLRRVFKYHNSFDVPSSGARRQLATMLVEDDQRISVGACRVWGNLFLHEDKRESFALLNHAVEHLLNLLHTCMREYSTSQAPMTRKHLFVVARTIARACSSLDVKKEIVAAPSFLTLFVLFNHPDEQIMLHVVGAASAIAEVQALRRYIAVPPVLSALASLLRDRSGRNIGAAYYVAWLRFIGIASKRDSSIQRLMVEHKVVECIQMTAHSPVASLDIIVLRECLDALAWLCTDDPGVRKLIATPKLMDLALKNTDSQQDGMVLSSLHILQRISVEDEIKAAFKAADGASVIMRVLVSKGVVDPRIKARAAALVRNLVTAHDSNKREFTRLGFIPVIVSIVSADRNRPVPRHELQLEIRGLQAIAAMCAGSSPDDKASKREVLECERSIDLLRCVSTRPERKLCQAWCEAIANCAQGSPSNQRKLVEASLTTIVVRFVGEKEVSRLQVPASRLLSYMAAFPDNRSEMVKQGGDSLLSVCVSSLQSENHELQRYIALALANLATRNDENKVRIGTAGTIPPLVDRLSSKQLNVVENVLHAIMKLGTHAGNKVKFGSKVCFEKLLALVHHDELAIKKGAVGAIAVLIEGNDGNKKFLLQCDAAVVAELCVLMKSANGKVVESVMLILGELSLIPEQILEISKYIDIVVIVRMVLNQNARIRRAALQTILNLTKEAFNKLRFGVQECINALFDCLHSEDMLIVELAATCLANLSFLGENATRISRLPDSLASLLKLAAASTTAKDYLSWKEARSLRLDRVLSGNKSPGRQSPSKIVVSATHPPPISSEEPALEEEVDDKLEPFVYSSKEDDCDSASTYQQVLDFSSFPTRQTSVLEQTLLVISNCGEDYHSARLVESVAVKVVCQALGHPSELVKRCSCFIIGSWCKKDSSNQHIATKQHILPILIQLLNSPNANIVEASLYALSKLAYFADNHLKLLQLDLVTTLVQNALRKPGNFSHEGLMDRTIRLLGTMVSFPKVRQTIKSEEIISDILTNLLQIHHGIAKNTTRLILLMLEEEPLKFFIPKKTVMMLRVIFTDEAASPKTIRNVLKIFHIIAMVEEHRSTIALEDSGDALSRMIDELHPGPEELGIQTYPPNASVVLSLLAMMTSTRKIAVIVHDKNVYALLPLYLTTAPESVTKENNISHLGVEQFTQDTLVDAVNALIISRQLCVFLAEKASHRLSEFNFSGILIRLLRVLTVHGSLSEGSFECLTILRLLSAFPRDQQVFLVENAAQVFLGILKAWIIASEQDGTVEGRQNTNNRSVSLSAFVTPLAYLLLSLGESNLNKLSVIQLGGISDILQGATSSHLTMEVRQIFAKSLSILCAQPCAVEWFEKYQVVQPLFRFMYSHRADGIVLVCCLRAFADIMETSIPCRSTVIGQPQILSFLLECLNDALQDSDRVHFAINALECLSMERELADALASMGDELSRVPELLHLEENSLNRATQYFATEMIGYMASYGHANKLRLEKPVITRILRFLHLEEKSTSGEAIVLGLWTLALLVKSDGIGLRIAEWLVEDKTAVDVIIKAGLLTSDALEDTTSSAANALAVLLSMCKQADVNLGERSNNFCTVVAAHLEAIEREVNVLALEILALVIPKYQFDKQSAGPCEQWSGVFRHLMEWMEVYARDPSRCVPVHLLNAFVCVSHITAIEELAADFRVNISRSGLSEIVGSALAYLDPTQRGPVVMNSASTTENNVERTTLLAALGVCENLMKLTSTYSERFFLLGVPQSIENALMENDDHIVSKCLCCMSHLADWSSSRQLLFSSFRCVSRLTELLLHEDASIVSKSTTLLSLMSSRIPGLPGLSSLDGVRALCKLVAQYWKSEDDAHKRIVENCSGMLLSLFSSDESVYVIFDQVDVIGKMFVLVQQSQTREHPLRVLVKMSGSPHSHPRFLRIIEPLCSLLSGSLDGSTSQHLVLCVLFNLFCREDDSMLLAETLETGKQHLLPQLLPLSRWLHISNAASIRVVLKLLHAYVAETPYKTLFNDGQNISSLLKLVANSNDEVASAAVQLLLAASSERDVEISVTVEDGIAILVRTLQKSTKWHLQCLILALLLNMCHDSEIPVLIMNEGGISRLTSFVHERKGVLFTADERMALSCKILRHISCCSNASTRLLEAKCHIRILDLNVHQESLAGDLESSLIMEILTNLALSGDATSALVDCRYHDHCIKKLIVHASGGDPPLTSKLALTSIQVLCKFSNTVREDIVKSTPQIVRVLENMLDITNDSVVATNALNALKYLSKLPEGRLAIFHKASTKLLQRVCRVILKHFNQTPTNSAQQESPNAFALSGVKFVGNLLSDMTPERFRVSWDCNDILQLTSLLGILLADHEKPRHQLHALHVLCGSFTSTLYFPLLPSMLLDLLNITLICPSKQHQQAAEFIIVKTFENPERAHLSIGGSQILEQFLIVFGQKTEFQDRRLLSPALAQVVTVSIDKSLVVSLRFLSKIITLLSTSVLAAKLEQSYEVDYADGRAWLDEENDEGVLTKALCVYVGNAYRSATDSSIQHSIRQVLRTEINSQALAAFIVVLLSMHGCVCVRIRASRLIPSAPKFADEKYRDSLTIQEMWVLNLLVDTVFDQRDIEHLNLLLTRVPTDTWLCFVLDFFECLCRGESSITSVKSTSSVETVAEISAVDAVKCATKLLCTVIHVTTLKPPSSVPSMIYVDVCQKNLEALTQAPADAHDAIETVLYALSCARSGWGDEVVITACQSQHFVLLLPRFLHVFHLPAPELNASRHLLLQLILLLVSSGSLVNELKDANVREAIENNECIPAEDKNLPITILGLLGYNADLNVEFERALQRFETATATDTRHDALVYLVNFLQLYSLTDEPLQERSIDCFMQHLTEESICAPTVNHEQTTRTLASYVTCLSKLSHTRKFVDLYCHRWSVDSILLVASRRSRLSDVTGFQESSVWSKSQLWDLVNIATRLIGTLEPQAYGAITDSVFTSCMALIDDLGRHNIETVERLISIFVWASANVDFFEVMCLRAGHMRSIVHLLPFVSSEKAFDQIFALLSILTNHVARIEMLGELLTELLTAVYKYATTIENTTREKLLLYILIILKRMGEDSLAGSRVYELAIQVILANVRSPVEIVSRCSWDLLGVLTELKPAIVAIFNFDGIAVILREYCGQTSHSPVKDTPKLPTRKSALSATDRTTSSQLNEITYRRMEAIKCLSKACRKHDEVLQKIGETMGIGAHLFRTLVGSTDGGSGDYHQNQEHAAHIIARIASQEYFRASLLSQDNVSCLIESLESVHPKIVFFALEALFYLCEFSICLDALVRHATVPVLGQILNSGMDAESSQGQAQTTLYVTGLLANMCSKSKVVCRRVVSSNLVPRMREFLRAPTSQIQYYATWIIKAVSKEGDLVSKLYEQRIVEALVFHLLQFEGTRTLRKAFGALHSLISLYRPGMTFVEESTLQSLVTTTAEAIHRLTSATDGQRCLARGLTVLEAIGAQSQKEKDLLFSEKAVELALQLVDFGDSRVKAKALCVVCKWLEDNPRRDHVRESFTDSAILSLVRAISAENADDALLTALSILNALLGLDEELRSKLSAMTNEVLLHRVSSLMSGSSANTLSGVRLRVLNEVIKSLVAMTKGGRVAIAASSSIENALDPLADVLRQQVSETLRMNALYLLVNFASAIELRPRMFANGTMNLLIAFLKSTQDEKLTQLCLLGMALLTAVDFSNAVTELLDAVDVLLKCLVSKNPSVQANAVWVVSNICLDDQLKTAIASRGAATTLQAVLNETLSGEQVAPGLASVTPSARPISSSSRIREYAPKAIKSLGFAPIGSSNGDSTGPRS